MMNNICDKTKCTGCAACYSICPRHCISFVEDEDGFLYPQIDAAACIDCALCNKICPANKTMQETAGRPAGYLQLPQTYAVMAHDRDMLKRSSSGGLFGILAQMVLQEGGAVFGAAYDESFNVSQIMIETWDQIARLQGSKYLQSAVKDSFVRTKCELDKGRQVLFTGTPCQIAGLKSFLRKGYSNLTTADIICHGVPNQKMFSSYLSYMEAKSKAKVTAYSFRDKKKWGWGNWGSISFTKQNGQKKTKYFPVSSDYYYSLYFEGNCFRESCYVCPFAKIPRQGDFTIGDFWGAERLLPNIEYKYGVSLMLVNTKHAKDMLNDMKTIADIISCELSEAVKHNATIEHATQRPASRDTLFIDMQKLGFEAAAKKYCKLSYVMPVLSRYLPRKLKDSIKRILGKP